MQFIGQLINPEVKQLTVELLTITAVDNFSVQFVGGEGGNGASIENFPGAKVSDIWMVIVEHDSIGAFGSISFTVRIFPPEKQT